MIVLLSAFLILVIYIYSVRNFQYWKRRGVKNDKPVPFFGNSFRQMTQQISISEMMKQMYEKYPNERFVGFYVGSSPGIILRDPELIKQVMVADFQSFHARGISPHKEVFDPLMKNIFTVDGDTWKLLRQRLTPAFTSGKLKAMFPLIVERARRLQQTAATAAKSNAEVDVRDLMARYTTDFIGACGFGIEADCLNDENSSFRRLGRRIFTTTARDAFVLMLKIMSPDTFKHLNFFAPEIETDTVELVKNIMQQRNYKVAGRNDFIDLLLELKQKGKIVGESVEIKNEDGSPKIVELELDDLLMAAQVFIFFAAGFETSSSTSSYMLHELAFHPDIQKKCQEEIDHVLNKHGKLSYEAVKEMKYLEMTLKESLRMLPPLGFLCRKCTKKYTFPGTNVIIDEDVLIAIPAHAIHMDEKYFEEPDKFVPERFSPENINNIKKYTYLPFGEGPRTCIGERLGVMQSMAGLAAVLSQFSLEPSKNTVRHLQIDPTSTIVQNIKGGVPLRLVPRKSLE